MTPANHNATAVVVLPAAGGGRICDPLLRRWLSRGDLERGNADSLPLARVLAAIDVVPPEQGLAALRLWGQTGDRPSAWVAAADPVYLEPQLDSLCLHALRRDRVDGSEMRVLIDHLQARLAGNEVGGFLRIGTRGYLSAENGFATAAVPSTSVDQRDPGEFLPRGDDAAPQRRVLSEIEMALHEHPVNLARAERGLPPVNSLWIWGGGRAPTRAARPLPPLWTDDPLLTGFWASCEAAAEPWPGTLAACIDAAADGFIAVVPEYAEGESLESELTALRTALRSGRLTRLRLLFRDGLEARLTRAQRIRVWRRTSPLLG